jgi:LDH2 family malate/lactate/ureidoglycolate dehydrogenase
MPTLTVDQLRPFSEAIFAAAGASRANAERVTEAMLSANLAGHDSHGVQHIPGYVREIERGAISGTAEPAVLRETATTALVSGGWTFGHVGAAYATRLAIAKARQHHLAMVGLVQANHIGRLGEYGEMGAAGGAIVMIMEGFGHKVAMQAPYGGAGRLLGTNPISIGIPAGEEPGMMLDFATTVVAAGKLAVAQAKGLPIAPGALVDAAGRPTTDPAALREGGAMLPFGGHKGYALALAIEFLGRVLVGGETYAASSPSPFNEAGTLILAIDPATFRPAADYAASADDLSRRVKAIPPADGFSEVLLPGEPERHSRETRLKEGIPIPEATWEGIVETARRLGAPTPTI